MTNSNLLNLVDGRAALTVAARFLLERRLSRFFKRNLVIDYNQWLTTGQFTLDTLLGQLNGLNDQEILNLYHLLGTVGGLPQSVSDTTIYVNGVTGDDATGDGTLLLPFKTLSFMETIPSILNHKYRVVLTGNVSDPNRDLSFNFDFGPNGSFALLGAGLPTVLQAGLSIGLGGLEALTAQGGSYIKTTPGFGPDATTSFLRCKNYAVPCHDNIGGDALMMSNPFTYAGVVPTDLVDVVRPAYTLTINSLGSFCKGFSGLKQSQLVICNLNIDFVPGYVGPPPPFSAPLFPKFKWHNDCFSTLSFVRFADTWTGNYGYSDPNGNSIQGGCLNTNVMVDDVAITALAACGLTNLDNPDPDLATFNPIICGAKFDGASGGLDIRGGAIVAAVDMHVFVNVHDAANISSSCFGKIFAKNALLNIYFCLLDGQTSPFGEHAGLEALNANINASNVTVLTSDNVVAALGGSFITMDYLGSDASYSVIGQAGLYCKGQNWIDAYYAAPGDTPLSLGMVGATGQIVSFTKTAGPVPAAWPALDVSTVFGHTTVIVEK